MTPHCFRSWLIGRLVDSMWEIPMLRLLGMLNCGMWEKSQRHPPQNCPFPWGTWTPSNTVPQTTWVHISNGILTGSAISAGLTVNTDRPTDIPTRRPFYSMSVHMLHLASAAMGPINKAGQKVWVWLVIKTRISYHWQTRTTRCFTANVLQTSKVHTQCDIARLCLHNDLWQTDRQTHD